MKKLVLLILTLSMILSVGLCPAQADEPTKIIWWLYASGDAPIDTQFVQEAANKYSAEKIGVVVELIFKNDEQFGLDMDTGVYYDMTFTCDWANSFVDNANNEMFYDITDLVKTATPALYERIDQKYWDVAGSLNGKIYAVPTLKDMASQQFFRMDKERYEAIGMELPESMEFADLEAYLAAYKDNYDDVYPLMLGKAGLTGMSNSAQWISGSYLCSPYHLAGTERENQIIPFWEDEVLMERFRLLHKWYGLGYINPDAATTETIGREIRASVRSGSAWAGYYSGYSAWGGMEVQGVSYAGPFMSTATMRGAMNAINAAATEEQAVACLKYLELLNIDRTFRDILRFGVEGTHFNYVDVDGVKAVERTEQGTNNWSMDGFVTGSVVNASVTSNAIYDWEKIYADYDKALLSTLGAFSFNKEDVEAECAACSAVMAKYNAELYTGTLDIDEMLPTIKEELEKAGIFDIQKEAQRQLDEYLGK
ncbi:MAG: ABC transporter substrate-binding protein [Christensenellales bacterium]|jgi:putative aldouronate transport system substrate-binding protein|nr:ABC transporter substrate-binding protein [Clostridiales bacterium]